MISRILAGIAVLFALTCGASAASCNPPSGFIVQNGTVNTGDSVVWGPGCGQLQSGTGGAVPSLTGTNIFLGDNFFGSGRPWCDPRSYGALGDQVHDDTNAFKQCRDLLQNTFGSGMIYVSVGNYCIKSDFILTGAGMRVFGENSGVQLNSCGTDTVLLGLNGPFQSVENISFQGVRSLGAVKPFAEFGASCVSCRGYNLLGNGGNGWVDLGGDDVLDLIDFTQSYGNAIVSHLGAGGALYVRRGKIDQVYPSSTIPFGATIVPWATATVYATGALVTDGNYTIQATSGGTSGGVLPSVPLYNVPIADGSVIWQLASPTNYCGVRMDTGTTDLFVENSDFTGSMKAGVCMSNLGSGTPPQFASVATSSFGENYTTGIDAAAGAGLLAHNNQFSACVSAGCSGVGLSGAWQSDASITDNLFISNPNGIAIAAGVNTHGGGNMIYGSSNAILIGANIGDWSFVGNLMGTSPVWGGSGNCINVQSGTSNNIIFNENDCNGTTNGIVNNSTGANQTIGLPGTLQITTLGLRTPTSQVLQHAPASGTPTISWGSNSGTPAVTGTAPFAIDAAGNGTCTGCLTNSPAALTRTNDTNITLTLGGTPATSLLQAVSMTMGFTGTLAAARLNANVVQGITNDTNVTGTITAQNLTLGWTGQASVPRGGTGVATLAAHGIPVGEGASPVAVAGPCATGKFLVWASGTGSDPTCQSQVSAFMAANLTTALAGGSTVFCANVGQCNVTQTNVSLTAPFGTTLSNLSFNSLVAPGAGNSYTLTIYTGAYGALAASTVTCQIVNTSTSCSDTTHSVTLTAGQSWSLQLVTSVSAALFTADSWGVQVATP